MKKFLSLIFCFSLVLAVATLPSCGDDSSDDPDGPTLPNITVDGAIDTDYGTAYTSGYGSSWGPMVDKLYVNSNGTNLYICVDFNPAHRGNNIWLFVDAVDQTGGLTDLSGDSYTGYGSLGITSNSISASMEWTCIGYREGNASDNADTTAPAWHIERERTIRDAFAGDFDLNDSSQTLTMAQDAAEGIYELSVPYSSIGAGVSTGQNVKVYVMFGNNAIASIAPAQSEDISASTLTTLDQAAPNHTLK